MDCYQIYIKDEYQGSVEGYDDLFVIIRLAMQMDMELRIWSAGRPFFMV